MSASSSVVEANLLKLIVGSSIALLVELPAASFRGEARIRAFRGEDIACACACPQFDGCKSNLRRSSCASLDRKHWKV